MFKKYLMLLLFVSASSMATETIKVVIPYAPGGGVSGVFYVVDDYASRNGIQLVPEFKPGAEGSIGVAHAANATPNGNTVLLTIISDVKKFNATNRGLIVPVSAIAQSPLYLVTGYDSNITSYHQLTDTLASQDGPISWAMPSLYLEKISNEFANGFCKSCNIIKVPFNGAGPALVNIIGNHVNVGIFPAAAATDLIATKKLRLLAYSSGNQNYTINGVPTFNHLIQKIPTDGYGIFLPAGVSAAEVEKLMFSGLPDGEQPLIDLLTKGMILLYNTRFK